MPDPATVRIVPRERGDAVFLVRYDDQGQELTDTWHASVDKAKRHAKLEYDIDEGDWVRADK